MLECYESVDYRSATTVWPFNIKGKAQDIPTRGWNSLFGTIAVKPGNTVWADYTQQELEQIYRKHSLVMACVRKLTEGISEPPLRVGVNHGDDEWEWLDQHPLTTVLNAPNKYYSQTDLVQYIVARLVLSGKSFIWKWRNRGSLIGELWPIPSSWVTPVTGTGNQLIASYRVKQGKGQELSLPPEDMFYARFIDPASTWDGCGLLQAASADHQLDQERMDYLKEMLDNLEVPGIILKTPLGLSKEQRDDLKAALRDSAGRGRRGSPLVLEGEGAGFEQPTPLSDLDWPGFSSMSEARICSAFGVPPILVGCRAGLERSTFANYGEARRSFYQDTLRPLWVAVGDTLTRGLLRNEGDEENEVAFDLDGISALQEDQTAVTDRSTKLFMGSVITRNEARAMVGQPPDPVNGDVYAVPLSVQFTPSDEPIEFIEGVDAVDTSVPQDENATTPG